MAERHGTPASRRLFVWFVATTIVPALGLGWLGWQLVQQDRQLDGQRVQEARDRAAELAATALQRTLAELEEHLASASAASSLSSGDIPEHVALIALGGRGVVERAGMLLPYGPAVPPADRLARDVFADAEALEFRGHDSAGAIRLLRTFATTRDPTRRAEALLRLGRNYRKLGELPSAAKAFTELVAFDHTLVGGLPAGLQGRQGLARILADGDRRDDLAREALLLDQALGGGHWVLTRGQYQFSAEQARGWLGSRAPPPHDVERLALAEAADAAWSEWRSARRDDAVVRGRRTLWVADRSVLALTRGSAERLVVLLAGQRFLDKAWRASLATPGGGRLFEFALTDADGRAVLGHPDAAVSNQSVRTASVTQLPWTVHAISAATDASTTGLSGPGRLMLAAVLVMTLVVIVGGYFINRAIARELAVAKLQSDFVAAVSHEFRTPLTTIRQLSEMLVRARVSTNEKRQQFYETLLRESERLHRLVQSLLNFAHLESGELQYQFEAVDPVHFVQGVVTEFQEEVSGLGYRIEFSSREPVPSIRADRELLARVFWNLLDNAVKYSPDHRTVRVEVTHADGRVLVRVCDEGVGIPLAEQREIFRKFVRGAASKAAAIKGTGIGLAMAQQIVTAHGGEIRVESEVGRGSTFSVLL